MYLLDSNIAFIIFSFTTVFRQKDGPQKNVRLQDLEENASFTLSSGFRKVNQCLAFYIMEFPFSSI